MGTRFRKSISLSKGVRLNIGKRGIGVSAGVKGLRVGAGPKGLYTSAGIPGTGVYSVNYASTKADANQPGAALQEKQTETSPSVDSLKTGLIVCLALAGMLAFIVFLAVSTQ